MSHPNKAARDRMKRYLRGDGIELGALHMPLDLSGCKVNRIRYVDRMSETHLRTHYPEIEAIALVPVDVIDDASTLATVPDGSLDFIIANHLIEHLSDPIAAVRCWYRKLKRRGILYMAVPDMRMTFDRDRPLTELQHFIEDHESSAEQRIRRDRNAFYEWVTIVN